MITYTPSLPGKSTPIIVRLEGTRVGEIHESPGGFRYFPKGGKPGEVFPTIPAVKRSLESDEV